MTYELFNTKQKIDPNIILSLGIKARSNSEKSTILDLSTCVLHFVHKIHFMDLMTPSELENFFYKYIILSARDATHILVPNQVYLSWQVGWFSDLPGEWTIFGQIYYRCSDILRVSFISNQRKSAQFICLTSLLMVENCNVYKINISGDL